MRDVKTPDFANLDPPAQPGESIAWCPLCGKVINRIPQGEFSGDAYFEARAQEHMLMAHDLEGEWAYAKLLEAVKQ